MISLKIKHYANLRLPFNNNLQKLKFLLGKVIFYVTSSVQIA